MAADLGLDDLVNAVKNLPANSMGFASNCIDLFEAAFLSDRNPFSAAAVDTTTPPPSDDVEISGNPATVNWQRNQAQSLDLSPYISEEAAIISTGGRKASQE